MDMYFFVPQSLQINKEKYNKNQFYTDLNNKIRFKTPQMSVTPGQSMVIYQGDTVLGGGIIRVVL